MKRQNGKSGVTSFFKKVFGGSFKYVTWVRANSTENLAYESIRENGTEAKIQRFLKARFFMLYLQAIEIFYLINK